MPRKPTLPQTTAVRLVTYGSQEWRQLIELNWTTYDRDADSNECLMVYAPPSTVAATRLDGLR